MITEEWIARRLPLWCALAELFLDTEMYPYHYQAVASAARDGGFASAQVYDILENEMWPAFSFNLLDVAGAWAGFPSDYVRTRMLETLAGVDDWPRGDFVFRGRFMREEWPLIEAALEGRAVCIPDESKGRKRLGPLILLVIGLGLLLTGLVLVFR